MTAQNFTLPFFGLVMLVAIGWLVWRGQRRARDEQEQAELQRTRMLSEAVARGVTDEYGNPLCAVCGDHAEHYLVGTGRPWFDRLPFVSRTQRLYALPWRYVVIDLPHLGPRLCAVHHRAAVQRLEAIHAELRAEHSRFNAKVQQRVAVLERGGLEQLLREDDADTKEILGLGMRRIVEPQLPAAEVHVLHTRPGDGN